jgi:pyrrolidone-carboxylate peptidase
LPLVFISGFGAFEAVARNPSGEIARALAVAPPRGIRVLARVLPVSFARAPVEWDRALGRRRPALCLALGVAKRPGFRLERYGRPTLKRVPRPDMDGRLPAEFSRPGPALETPVDLGALRAALRRRGVERVRVSRRSGGYVCERICHHVLKRARELGVPALFIHVPPERFTPLAQQVQVVRWVLEELRASLNGIHPRDGGAGSRRERSVATPRKPARPRKTGRG